MSAIKSFQAEAEDMPHNNDEFKWLRQRVGDVVTYSVSLPQVTREVYTQPTKKIPRNLPGTLKFSVRNSQYSYALASPRRLYIFNYYQKKSQHKKIQASHRALCQKRRDEKHSKINKDRNNKKGKKVNDKSPRG